MDEIEKPLQKMTAHSYCILGVQIIATAFGEYECLDLPLPMQGAGEALRGQRDFKPAVDR